MEKDAQSPASALISALFTTHVSVKIADEEMHNLPLFPSEQAHILTSVDRRQRDFIAGRNCARLALSQIGAPIVAIPKNEDRSPRWPPGYTGSITHCEGFCCAVVTSARNAVSLGVDAENILTFSAGMTAIVCHDAELREHEALPSKVNWPNVTFSAKEALFKCYYQITRRFLDFHDIQIRFAGSGVFLSSARDPSVLRVVQEIEGRWAADSYRTYAGATLRPVK